MKKLLLLFSIMPALLMGCTTPQSVRDIEEARALILSNFAENSEAVSVEILDAWAAEAKNHVDYITTLAIEQHTDADGKIDREVYEQIRAVQQEKYDLIHVQYMDALAVLELVQKDLRDLVDLQVELQKYFDQTGKVSEKLEEHASVLIERIRTRYDTIRELMGK